MTVLANLSNADLYALSRRLLERALSPDVDTAAHLAAIRCRTAVLEEILKRAGWPAPERVDR